VDGIERGANDKEEVNEEMSFAIGTPDLRQKKQNAENNDEGAEP